MAHINLESQSTNGNVSPSSSIPQWALHTDHPLVDSSTQLRLLYLRQPSGRVSGGYGKPLLMSRLAEHIRHKLHKVANRMACQVGVYQGTNKCFASSRIFNEIQDSGGFINDHMMLTGVFLISSCAY